MTADLIARLRCAHEHSQQRIVGSNIFQEAATAIEAKDAEIERLRAERDKWDRRVAYDELAAREYENRARQQRQIDDLTVRAEQAERALAEALSVVESLLLSLGNNNSDRVKAARQFVKEHTP